MKLGIIFKCDEASHICDKSQYAESSFTERLLMKVHQMICKVCRQHSVENSKLTDAVRKANLKIMPERAKFRLKEMIQQEISK